MDEPMQEVAEEQPNHRTARILQSFSQTTQQSLEEALETLQTTEDDPTQRLEHLLLLQSELNQIVGDRIRSTRQEIRDLRIAQSPLLSQPPSIWHRIASGLDEVALWQLEKATNSIYNTCASNQRPCWDLQWHYLDQIRHSKSGLRTHNPRLRGLQFAQASLAAQRWEQTPRFSSRSAEEEDPLLRLKYNHHDHIYQKQDFVDDFGYFFQDPTAAGKPPVEFFLRLTYRDQQHVLLEGFQSNFISLRHTRDAQDCGNHTYIGAGGDRLQQAVMVRNDLHLLEPFMGLDERFRQMDSDDSELELLSDYDDEEEEFHFLQWPEASRRTFLQDLTMTLLRSSTAAAGEPPRVVGSTRGYSESDQHFAIFRPLQLVPIRAAGNGPNNNNHHPEEEEEEETRPVVQIGLGCGGGNSLHIVLKWVQSY